jgi:L-asparagine oxygenase
MEFKMENKLVEEHIIEFTFNEIVLLLKIAKKITADPYNESELFCKQSKECSIEIPERIKKILLNFASNGSQKGFILFKQIPINNLSIPKTPFGNTYNVGEKTVLAKIQSLFINIIGELIAYEAEGGGHLFQDIVPNPSMSNSQSSLGSNVDLEIHTEQAFSDLRPDVISLACLRGDVNAFTYIFPVKKLIENMNNNELQLLYKPLWRTGVDLSFKLNGIEFIKGDIRGPFPILYGDEKDPLFIFDQDLMKGISKESNDIIEKVINIYYKNRIEYNLKAGEIILIDNRRAIHGRSSFFPKYDGYDRFLTRCFATFDYEKTAYARSNNSRIISAIYS